MMPEVLREAKTALLFLNFLSQKKEKTLFHIFNGIVYQFVWGEKYFSLTIFIAQFRTSTFNRKSINKFSLTGINQTIFSEFIVMRKTFFFFFQFWKGKKC